MTQAVIGVLALAAALCVAILVVTACFTLLCNVYDRVWNAGARSERAWAQQRLRIAAWWFSEDEPTMRLLMDLANDSLQEWQARDKWQKARAGGTR